MQYLDVTVSSLNGIGKSKWMKLIQNDDYKSALALFGGDVEISERILETIETIVCELYGTNQTSITEARYKKFCKKSMSDPCMLPPTKGELELHIKRANYQTFIWKKAVKRELDIPSPVGHGWDVKDGYLEVVWMTEKPAPESILEMIVCSCKWNVVLVVSVCNMVWTALRYAHVCSDTHNNLLADDRHDDDDNDSSNESDCGDETDNESNFEDNLEDEISDNV